MLERRVFLECNVSTQKVLYFGPLQVSDCWNRNTQPLILKKYIYSIPLNFEHKASIVY